MEDWKKKYEDAIERLKQWDEEHPHGYVVSERDKFIFPELAESEDERIRKAIFKMMKVPRKEIFEAEGITKEQALSYLEKQKDEVQRQFNLGVQAGREEAMYEMEKEQKPAEWSEEENGILLECVSALQNNSHWLLADKLSSLRPQPKQKRHLGMKDQWCCNSVWAAVRDSDAYNGEEKQFILDFLQRCMPQPHWKPSEEQMAVLYDAISNLKHDNYKNIHVLESLYNYLQKLP